MASLSASQTNVSENESLKAELQELKRQQAEESQRKKQLEELENKKQRAANHISKQTILTREPTLLSISSIVENFELNKYTDSDKKYRLPVHQRDSNPESDWEEELVISILFGKSIGAIHISEHFYGNNKTYYDIEDGRTRIIASHRFHNNKFTITIDGDEFYFKQLPESLQSKFKGYIISCICIKKNNTTIGDSVYKLALRDNFTKLQEGRQLTPYDLYWTWDNLEDGTSGSPLIVFTNKLFKDAKIAKLVSWCGAKNMNRRGDKNRKPITQAVSLVTCAWKGNDCNNYSKEDYNGKRDILSEPIDDEQESIILRKLYGIQYIIDESLKIHEKQSSERLGEFVKNKFTATIMEDFDEKGEMSQDNKLKWINLITEIRKKKSKIEKNEFLDTQVYAGLSKGAKQGNCNYIQIIERESAINDWWETYNNQS